MNVIHEILNVQNYRVGTHKVAHTLIKNIVNVWYNFRIL